MGKPILGQMELRALLKTFKEQNAGKYHILALGYYGSYARNQATEDSDVDVVFDTDEPNLFTASAMRLDLEELLQRPVGLVRLRGLTDTGFKARVESEAVYV
jgi:predicted nucleotidyltransferase